LHQKKAHTCNGYIAEESKPADDFAIKAHLNNLRFCFAIITDLWRNWSCSLLLHKR
jgi:hypothetical protein